MHRGGAASLMKMPSSCRAQSLRRCFPLPLPPPPLLLRQLQTPEPGNRQNGRLDSAASGRQSSYRKRLLLPGLEMSSAGSESAPGNIIPIIHSSMQKKARLLIAVTPCTLQLTGQAECCTTVELTHGHTFDGASSAPAWTRSTLHAAQVVTI